MKYTSIPEVDASLASIGNDETGINDGTPRNEEGNIKIAQQRTPAQQRALYALTVTTWCSMISFGMFAAFHYVRRAWIVGDWESWELSDMHLYRPERPTANAIMSLHMFTGIFLMMAGPTQLIPFLRKHHIRFHRWIGRIYIVCALITASMAVTFVLLYRTSRCDIYEDVGNVIFGSAMILSAIQSYRHVRYTHDLQAHQWWSYRLFAVALAAVLFRLILVLYLAAITVMPSYHGTKWIYEGIYFIFCLPTWLVVWLYQRLPPPTATNGRSHQFSSWMHSAPLFWVATILVFVTTLLMLVFDWVPSILNIDVGQGQGVEHPF